MSEEDTSQQKCCIDKVTFYTYVAEGRVEQVKACIEAGLPTEIATATEDTESPLHIAVLGDSEEMVDVLLSNTNFVMATNMYWKTPLHLACGSGRLDVARKLLQHGAEIDYKDCGECTPLFHSVNNNQVDMVQLLVEAGCDLDTLNEELITPLDQALLHNRKEIISLLIKAGCAIDKSDGLIYYPDHYANHIVFSLLVNNDLGNIKLLNDCGYTMKYSYMQEMFQKKHILAMEEEAFRMLMRMAQNPHSLSNLCRTCIRRTLQAKRYVSRKSLDSMIDRLDVPEKLRRYLSVCDT
ncbi:poly [ADP-ribose] polymerase tankyrase-like [Haliotis rubra]|uniref:poly [ADP-ribose] polymerase tankyrase-like n=1 Tax=Haliotis rubra TaxID=36100 RepID=UPI001EE5D064|nr:poly [ADP-ribose] polymerase tankyrase-like [Haliotis rubra]XP_046569132.1 poly [ADP-ribose] polymerase tankyrase-like [Haliotis rubra]XP_046569133.1 poly [ADP-ribose] polymerase tankyrase-like [Haliotis rubra]XP_046569134.1 poly [ADP-ribose] polymerase tankyrase-like [Haliotis rubra]XP_046569135.1 poly [ADP-ribose] polymerase tankyrase-like [Haliotis rubra]